VVAAAASFFADTGAMASSGIVAVQEYRSSSAPSSPLNYPSERISERDGLGR